MTPAVLLLALLAIGADAGGPGGCEAPAACAQDLVNVIGGARLDPGGARARELDVRRRLVRFGQPGLDAVVPLLDHIDAPVAAAAARTIEDFGAQARSAATELRRVAGYRDGEVASAAERALARLGEPARVEALVAALDAPPPGTIEPWNTLMRLIRLGATAHDATPALIERARRARWKDRWQFVETLAWVGDDRAVLFLTEALTEPDWRVTLAAERALGRLGAAARPALPALEAVAGKHWLPRARTLAEDARAAIAGATPRPPQSARAFARMQPEMSDGLRSRAVPGGCREEARPAADGWRSAKDLSTRKPPRGLTLTNVGPMGTYVPHPVDGGLLVGSNRGEFGGDLRLLSRGRETLITDGNVFAIVQRPWALVLVQGAAHGGARYGTVSVLERGRDGRWIARPHLELPAPPSGLRQTVDGGLAIATTTGTLVLGPSGAVERFDCREFPPAP